jgi:hypothetical protein
MPWVTVKEIEDALNAADFPADKDELIAQAAGQDAGDNVVKALRSLPPEIEYANLGEVIRSVHADVGSPPTAEQQALRARNTRGESQRISERFRPPP